MFTKPSKIITIDTLIGLKGISSDLVRKKIVHNKSIILKKERLVINSPPDKSNSVKMEQFLGVPKVEMNSCYKELPIDGASIIWVGDGL